MNSQLKEKFFKKECTPEEARQVLEWFSRQEVESWQEDDLHAFWQEAEKDKYDPEFAHDPQQMLEWVHQQIDQRQPALSERSGQLVSLSDSWAYALRVAAILFIPFLFTWLFVDFSKTQQTVESPSVITIEAPAGVKRTKVLPDGSKVMLNARSAITYAADFNEHKREVKLAGEAFFQVAKDSLRPFTVHSGDISTTALSTSFNINYQPDRAVAEVSLATGVVQVATKDRVAQIYEDAGGRIINRLS